MGGGTYSDTVGQQHDRPPVSNVAVVSGTREEGGLDPWRRGGHILVANIRGGGGRDGTGRDCRGWGGGYIKQDYMDEADNFWQQQRPPTAEEVKSILERPHKHLTDFKKLSVSPSHTRP